MIKAVFFDFDGVLALESTGADAISKALAKQTGIPYDELRPVYGKYGGRLVRQHKRYETIIKPLNHELKTHLTVKDIIEAVKTSTRNRDMLSLAQDLRAAGYMTGIITDNNIDRIDVLREPFGLDDFSPLVVSAEVGYGKWQGAKIFEIALDRAGLKPQESLFIDNFENNLTFAAETGMQTYWHDDKANDVAAFRNRLADLGILKRLLA